MGITRCTFFLSCFLPESIQVPPQAIRVCHGALGGYGFSRLTDTCREASAGGGLSLGPKLVRKAETKPTLATEQTQANTVIGASRSPSEYFWLESQKNTRNNKRRILVINCPWIFSSITAVSQQRKTPLVAVALDTFCGNSRCACRPSPRSPREQDCLLGLCGSLNSRAHTSPPSVQPLSSSPLHATRRKHLWFR